LRGELDSTTTALFSRTDGSANANCINQTPIDEINWQRVQLPTGTLVIPNTLEITGTGTAVTSPAFTAVDPTRTAIFAGGQWGSGQAGGETDLSSGSGELTSRGRDTLTNGATTTTVTRSSN